jgi:hypothetical protein
VEDRKEYEGARLLTLTPHEAAVLSSYAQSAREAVDLDDMDPEDRSTTAADVAVLDSVLTRVKDIMEHPRVAATSRFEVPDTADVDEYLYDEVATYWAGASWERRLIMQGTYGRSGELLRLLDEPSTGEARQAPTPRAEDIMELWSVFRGAEDFHDGETTLTDFGNWLLATGAFGEEEDNLDPAPCKVIW